VKQANSPNQKNVYISQLDKQSQVSNAALAHTHDVHPIPPQLHYHLSFSFLFSDQQLILASSTGIH
jgi:hypothetical protein